MVRMKITDEMIRAALRETPYWKRLEELFLAEAKEICEERIKKACVNIYVDYGGEEKES
jgi:hypothetical protein